VQGEEFYVWEGGDGVMVGGLQIWIGLRDGKVCDKWFCFLTS
jgi:hypothetical protein